MHLTPSLALVAALILAPGCGPGTPADDDSVADDDTSGASDPEPLDLPADPAAPGVPVGVTTVATRGVTLEVWYPAPDAAGGDATEVADLDQFVPEAFHEAVAAFTLPPLDTGAVRDAALRVPEAPYPVVLFSHGMGGFRLQSFDYTVHLASRGYVVVAADHPGRMMPDILPCLLDPPLEGCDLSGMLGDDPAIEDLSLALDWVEEAAEEGFFAGALDPSRIGLSGHSAGGASTATLGETDARLRALLVLASGGATVDRDVPALLMGATCDSFATVPELDAAVDHLQDGHGVAISGAGHLAFSDLCSLDLGPLAEEVLAPRDDLNEGLYSLMLDLAVDGCPGIVPAVTSEDCATGYLPLEVSGPIVRHYSTAFFDRELRGTGPGVEAGLFPEAQVR